MKRRLHNIDYCTRRNLAVGLICGASIALCGALRWVGTNYETDEMARSGAGWGTAYSVVSAALWPFPTEQGKWYILRWEDRVKIPPMANTLYYVDTQNDDCLYYNAYRASSQEFVQRRVVFRAKTSEQHVRFIASQDGVLEVRNVFLSACPVWVGMAAVYWYVPLVGACIGMLWILRRELVGVTRRMTQRYARGMNHCRWGYLAIATVVVYGAGALTVIIPMARNNGWTALRDVLWHVGGVPATIGVIMYACGWPVAVWVLQGARRRQCELLVSVCLGHMLLMCTYSMSAMGIRSHVVAVCLVAYVSYTWGILLGRGIRPVAPDVSAATILLIAAGSLWLMMWPHRTERDVWPSTIHNADISAYVTESAALRQWSAQEICKMAAALQEPTFLAYKADTIRGLPFQVDFVKVSDATEHMTAVLSWLLNTAAEHVIGAYTSCMVPLVTLILGGIMLLLVPARLPAAVLTACGTCTCFPLIYLQRDAYLNQLHGLVLVMIGAVAVTMAINRRALRWAVVGGGGVAALSMSFLVLVPMLVAVCGVTVAAMACNAIRRRQYRTLKRGWMVLTTMAVSSVAGAPHALWYALNDVLRGRLGTQLVTTRPYHPERHWTLLGGFAVDWIGALRMPHVARWYVWMAIVASICGIIAVCLWVVTTGWRRGRPLCFALLSVTAGGVLWSYINDPSRYGYFKMLVTGSVIITVCACMAWATLERYCKTNAVRRVVVAMLGVWFAARLINMPIALALTRPVDYLNERVTSVAEVVQMLPSDACIMVDVTDYIYTPLLHMYLRPLALRSQGTIGYSVGSFVGNDYRYVLTTKLRPEATEVWNNGYYWLYSVVNQSGMSVEDKQ